MTSRKNPCRQDDPVHDYILVRSNPGRRVRLCVFMAACFFSTAFPSTAQSPGQPADPSVTRQMHEAVSVAQRGDEKHALALVGSLLEQHPDFVPALKLQAMLLEDTGNGKAASVSYEKALKFAPNDAELLLKVGVFELVKGNTNQAITLLTQRLKALPKDKDSLYYLAQAYHLKGEDNLALEDNSGGDQSRYDSRRNLTKVWGVVVQFRRRNESGAAMADKRSSTFSDPEKTLPTNQLRSGPSPVTTIWI